MCSLGGKDLKHLNKKTLKTVFCPLPPKVAKPIKWSVSMGVSMPESPYNDFPFNPLYPTISLAFHPLISFTL